MSGEQGRGDRARQERLRAALRENLKRRKQQAKGRTGSPSGRAIITPEDDAAGPPGGEDESSRRED
ncbi:hypothetical protein [Afipia carboxidovorans]|uniref:hypothetical protein n=1 Tax=Afipia carboxidovorans TaxID=40137 RepID=UPI00017F5D1D|nr:hypothetical protein [Afipia carboxidovorans]